MNNVIAVCCVQFRFLLNCVCEIAADATAILDAVIHSVWPLAP